MLNIFLNTFALSLTLMASSPLLAPFTLLKKSGVVSKIEFTDAHAMASAWVFYGKNGGHINGVFINEAQTLKEANQLMALELSMSATAVNKFSANNQKLLVQSTEILAQQCMGLNLNGLKTLIQQAQRKAIAGTLPVNLKGKTATISIDQADTGVELTVSLEMPSRLAPKCAMPVVEP